MLRYVQFNVLMIKVNLFFAYGSKMHNSVLSQCSSRQFCDSVGNLFMLYCSCRTVGCGRESIICMRC